jgi:hypothetical protein
VSERFEKIRLPSSEDVDGDADFVELLRPFAHDDTDDSDEDEGLDDGEGRG